MANTRTYNRSFAGGEISPEMYGRIDDAKFQSGAATMRNFIAAPTGAATNRPGFAYVNSTKNNGVARLIPFTYSLNQTMVIEVGAGYFRFHTLGQTLKYSSADASAWIAPSGAISLSYSSPTVVTWPAHGLTTGDPIRFYLVGSHQASELPLTDMGTALQVGYTYTVQVISPDFFYILDGFDNVGLIGSGSGTSTNYDGSGSTSSEVQLGPNQSSSSDSAILSGLANVPVPGGVATLTLNLWTDIAVTGGAASVKFLYSTGGSWNEFYYCSVNTGRTVTTPVQVQIPVANIDLIELKVSCAGNTFSGGSCYASGGIDSWSVSVPQTAGSSLTFVQAYRYYTAGDLVSYGGSDYAALQLDAGGMTTPGTDATIWSLLSADLTYEIANPYAAADLFDIHYTQSMDVMTLVHPNYPPAELRRLSASGWSYVPIDFGPPLSAPANVAVAASPGYLAQIASVTDGAGTQAGQALITTQSSHTLAMGDAVYVAGLTFTPTSGNPVALDGFYMVSNVPVDSSGNLINNELYLMDYSGNNIMFQSAGTYSAGTIQYGTKIYNITNYYAVTAIASDGVSTSALSAECSVLNNLDVPGSYNTVTWAAVAGAQNYNVYKQLNGLWGFIGNTAALSFVDNNIAPDMSITPATPDPVFSGPGNYPGSVTYFQQRRCFAGTGNAPANVWMSNSGTESMFSYSIPSMDTDRIAFRVAALQADVIQHMIPMIQLILLTSEAEFALVPGGTNAITPSTIAVNPQSYVGASNVQPTIINTTMVYAAARGGHVRELGYAWTVNGYMTGDLSLRAAHLFDNLSIVDQAYAKAPYPIVWFVSSNGNLLGLTYIPEEQLGAWHRHDTEGSFESIACVAEGNDDVLYAVINRTINGQTVRYVERMPSVVFDTLSDAFFVDAGITQTFANPVTQISGLTWLEGATVAVLADGGVQAQKTVVGGAITLDYPASTVTVGLPYTSDLMTLPAVLQLDGYGQGRMKNINKAWVKLYLSSGILVGPDEDHLTEIAQRTTEPWGSPPALQTAELLVMTTPSWQAGGQVLIRQQNPLPLTVAGLTMEVSIGG